MQDASKQYYPTLTELSLATGIVRSIHFSGNNHVGLHKFGERELYHFNVLSLPTQFVMSPCRGFP